MNQIVYDVIGKFLDNFEKLPHLISSCYDSDAFKKQWKEAYGSEEARGTSNAIYVWTTDKPIKRVRGESQILYIGKTTQSLYDRHYGYYSAKTKDWNWERYKYILNCYGNIHFYYKHFDISCDLLEIEKNLIWSYFIKHLEYPPINTRN